MIIKPKAQKFRIRRSNAPTEPGAREGDAGESLPRTEDDTFGPADDGFGDEAFPTAASSGKASKEEITAEIEAIKKEGLTGRQLRMARRVAMKHGLPANSDYDAIRLLRIKGIDPFQRSAILELVVPEKKPDEGEASRNLPQTVDVTKLPSTQVMNEETRAREVNKIRRDIVRRRRRQLALLAVRLLFFVALPTFVAGWYFYRVATPMYATKSEFLIQQADAQSSGSLGGLFSGTGFATSQDSITVQSYLQSREAMLRLDADIGYKSHFSQDFVDPLQRLEADSTNEEAYKLYKKLVKIGYDPTEGIIKMEVVAADPKVSEQYSLSLLAYAEEQVDHLTQRLREDQMQGSRESYEDAELKMQAAQERVLQLQERLGVVDPVSETSAVIAQITALETQLQEKNLQLQQLLDNSRPNQARVDGVRGDIGRIEEAVAGLRAQLTVGGGDNASMVRTNAELKLAETDLETRIAMVQQALLQLETARIEANRQVRYLSLGVSPVAPDEPTYPRRFENTLVAFLIFCGLYLMASLTASILREQVSA